MKKIFIPQILVGALAIGPFVLAPPGMARTNSLTAGMTLAYDYYDRQETDTVEIGESGGSAVADDDYSRLVLTPLLRYVSTSARDSLELSAAPSVRYDLDDSETEWDGDLFLGADRYLTELWQIRGSNRFVRSDYSSDDSVFSEDPDSDPQTPETEPQLSSDLGRTRYWRNTLDLASEYRYSQDSLALVGFNWSVLRNDDDDRLSDDYDRYTVTLRDEHRFDIRWRSVVEFSAVRGEFQTAEADAVSEDLWEYYLGLSLENNSIEHNPLFLDYNFIAIEYDEPLQGDGEAHQLRLSWRHDASPQLYTIIGAGPSYLKTEGQDDSWGYNGIAEVNYLLERGSYRLALEKGYAADSFSGTEERGFVDFWDAGFYFTRLLTENLSLDGRLGYRWEERTEFLLDEFEEYQEDRYSAGLGLDYAFSRYYSARVGYSFVSLDSDRAGFDYDDHRILLSLSWERELLRW